MVPLVTSRWKTPEYPYLELIFSLSLPALIFRLLEDIFTKIPPCPTPPQIPDLRAGISRIEFVISSPVPFHPPAFPMSFNSITNFQSCLKPRMVLLALAPHVPLVAKVCGLRRFYIVLFLHSLCWVCPPLQGFGVLGPYHCGSLWLTALPLYVLTGTA